MNPAKYWSSLDAAWKKFLTSELEIDGPAKVKKLASVKDVYLDEKFASPTLAPLEAFEKLREFSCDAPKVKDLSVLAGLGRLEEVRLSSKGVKDFSPLAKLSKLKSLDVSETAFDDLSVVAKLPLLWHLNLSGTKVKDLRPLAGAKRLEQLDLAHTKVSDLSPLAGLKKLNDLNLGGLKLESFSVLSKLPLRRVDAAGSNLKDLAPFVQDLHLLDVLGTGVPFHQVLTLQDRLRGREGRVASDHGEPKALLTELGRLDFPLEGLEATLTGYVHNALTTCLKKGDAGAQKLAVQLLTRWLEQPASKVQHELTQTFLANAVAALTRLEVPEAVVKGTLALVPQEPTEKVLAFNLACYFARRKDQAQALRLVKLALASGQEAARFREDADFAGLLKVPEFQALLAAPQLPDPEAEPEAWWNSLSEDLRSRLSNFEGLSSDLGQAKADILAAIHAPDFALWIFSLDTLDHLRGLVGLKSLTLEDVKVRSLEPLRTLVGLESLTFTPASRAKALDWSPLAGCTKLRSLTISDAQVDLALLASITKVTELSLRNVEVTSLEALGTMTQLTSLSLALDEGTVDASLVTPLTKLTSLSLEVESLLPLAGLKSLTTLRVQVKSATPCSLEPLAGLTRLTELDLGGTTFGDPAPLAALKNLKRLRLTRGDPKLAAVKKLLKTSAPGCEVRG